MKDEYHYLFDALVFHVLKMHFPVLHDVHLEPFLGLFTCSKSPMQLLSVN